MLRNNAKKVFAVDVGRGQLDYSLRNSPKVVSLEKVNARNMAFDLIGETCGFISMDVSFISVKKIIPNILKFLNSNGKMIVLIKPQFEAGRKFVQKGGIVTDKEVHKELIRDIEAFCNKNGLFTRGLTHSPIKGPSGNIEYLLYLDMNPEITEINEDEKVESAFKELNK
jgi:23S rRNA (cytidine1920-2'-O)/16S rRNA (cytidine1409-2'-O)-methyltransferase